MVPLQCPLQVTSPPLPQRDCGKRPSVYSIKMTFVGCSLERMMTKARQILSQGPEFANVFSETAFSGVMELNPH